MAEKTRPYWFIGRKSLDASSTGTITFSISSSEHFHGRKIRFHSTGAFDITGITRENDLPFTNADTTTIIDSYLLLHTGTTSKNKYDEIYLDVPLELPPDSKLTFHLTDTSAGTNEVFILILGTMERAA